MEGTYTRYALSRELHARWKATWLPWNTLGVQVFFRYSRCLSFALSLSSWWAITRLSQDFVQYLCPVYVNVLEAGGEQRVEDPVPTLLGCELYKAWYSMFIIYIVINSLRDWSWFPLFRRWEVLTSCWGSLERGWPTSLGLLLPLFGAGKKILWQKMTLKWT